MSNLLKQRDYVGQLLGWLSGDIPELHAVECGRLIESWRRFDTTFHKPETNVTEQSIEQEIQAKGLTAPRLTPSDIDATIVAASYHVFDGTTTTVCCLLLRNGFNVVGTSAAASPANFDEAIGRKIAFDKAREQVWQLQGYLLRQKLHDASVNKANFDAGLD